MNDNCRHALQDYRPLNERRRFSKVHLLNLMYLRPEFVAS